MPLKGHGQSHLRIGVWGLPFHVIVSLTGAFLGLTTIIVGVLALADFKDDANQAYALFMGPHPVDDPRPAPRPLLQPMLAACCWQGYWGQACSTSQVIKRDTSDTWAGRFMRTLMCMGLAVISAIFFIFLGGKRPLSAQYSPATWP